MSAQAVWKGVLAFPDAPVPVKLNSAVEDRGVDLRLLHREDRVPVRQVMVHPETGEAVPRDEARKAYPASRDTLVMLREEELEDLDPEPSREIELTRFVPASLLDPRWYDRPYYLGPDEEPEAWQALARALRDTERVGIARWAMRNRRYVGALGHRDGYPLLVTLRHPREIVETEELGAPDERPAQEDEREMARELVEGLSGELDLGEFEDTYRRRVLELIEEKAEEGEVVLPPRSEADRPPSSLEDALEASLERLREERRTA